MNTAVLMLRALQQGLSIDDMALLEVGELTDIFIEAGNDNFDYPKKGTQEDYKRLFGV